MQIAEPCNAICSPPSLQSACPKSAICRVKICNLHSNICNLHSKICNLHSKICNLWLSQVEMQSFGATKSFELATQLGPREGDL